MQWVCSREWKHSANAANIGSVGSQSWGQPLGKANTNRKKRRKRAGAGPRAERVKENGLLKQCWGQQDHPCASHISIFGAVPSSTTTGADIHMSAKDRDPAGCDAPVCPHNDREYSLLRGTDIHPGQSLGRGLVLPLLKCPPTAPRPFPFPGVLLLLISLPRTFRHECFPLIAGP